MKSQILTLLIFCVMLLIGCSGNTNQPTQEDSFDEYEYKQQYDKGYRDGYEIGYDTCRSDYSKDLNELEAYQSMIVSLIYDKEFDVLYTLLDYNRDEIESVLESEMGTTDLDEIIDYFEEQSQTVIGPCEICGESVYADESPIFENDIECAHFACVHGEPAKSGEVISTKKR